MEVNEKQLSRSKYKRERNANQKETRPSAKLSYARVSVQKACFVLDAIRGKDVRFIIIPIAVGALPLIILRWRLNLLTVEDETAKTMGVNTRILRLVVVFCATLLTAASVSVSGMIGWVGLVIPHFARMLFGFDYRRLIPAMALFGAAFLLVVDDIARVATTGELPLGILTSFVGAPIFFYLLVTGKGRYA